MGGEKSEQGLGRQFDLSAAPNALSLAYGQGFVASQIQIEGRWLSCGICEELRVRRRKDKALARSEIVSYRGR